MSPSTAHSVLSRLQVALHVTRRTFPGASHTAEAIAAWSVKPGVIRSASAGLRRCMGMRLPSCARQRLHPPFHLNTYHVTRNSSTPTVYDLDVQLSSVPSPLTTSLVLPPAYLFQRSTRQRLKPSLSINRRRYYVIFTCQTKCVTVSKNRE